MIKPDIEALGVQERIYSASPVRPTGSRRGQAVGWEASAPHVPRPRSAFGY